MVEVKNQDGIYQEATITKLTDASLYTVGKWVGGWGWGLHSDLALYVLRCTCLNSTRAFCVVAVLKKDLYLAQKLVKRNCFLCCNNESGFSEFI